ncbi:hypothetical protein FNV43_RR26371 [Rhamnella rubrinervis]|uniref:Uncharacterized protein n=1 Tax=Rhamnella rubrinervis TaxID=2594499 RepID=A0A8K0DPQ6_9ROSA|nr:hypothetical protein FNV43_RR26371 [Rhamnella rubrinervis]
MGEMGEAKKEESQHSSFLGSISLLFKKLISSAKGDDEHYKSSRSAAKRTGPEDAMIAASKHFSSAHKIRFN